tara:strand:- start:162 stop:329 length:168 start_codon:yes stop_codon:yes gene_type:complete
MTMQTISLKDHLVAADASEATYLKMQREFAARRTARRIQRLRSERLHAKRNEDNA